MSVISLPSIHHPAKGTSNGHIIRWAKTLRVLLMPYIRADDGLYERRDIDEFIGVCRALIADGEIDESDFDYLARWVSNSHELHDLPVVSDLCAVVQQCARTGNTTQSRSTMLESLKQFVGSPQGRGLSTSLPFEDPEPRIDFVGKRFCFTGDFDFGSRSACEDEVIKRGGIVQEKLRSDVDYLVVGSSASDAWLHSNFGTKIARAVRWRANRKYNVAIVSEDHWLAAVSRTGPASNRRTVSAAALSTRDQTVTLASLHVRVEQTREPTMFNMEPRAGEDFVTAAENAGRAFGRLRARRWEIVSWLVIGLSIRSKASQIANSHRAEPLPSHLSEAK